MNRYIPFSRQKMIVAMLMAAGLLALWWFRSPVSDFLAWVSDRQAVAASVQQYGMGGPLVLFLLIVFQVFIAVLPGHALMLAGAYIYGFVVGLLINLSATVLGTQLAFWIARRYGRAAVYGLANPDHIRRWDRFTAHQSILSYYFTFVLPMFPSDLMSYVGGLGAISPKRFFVANLLGRFTVAAFITLIGANGLQMPVFFWVSVALALAVLIGAWRVYNGRSEILA